MTSTDFAVSTRFAAPLAAAPRIAVLLPCYNEEIAVGECVRAFKMALPDAEVYVYDNNSRDRTAEMAHAAGAIVRSEKLQGKGNVVRRMFADVEADIYVMADGDNTYDATRALAMIDRLRSEHLDMVVGSRMASYEQATYRRGHRTGNFLITWTVGFLFGHRFRDMLSGYRVFSRRFVKTFPALSGGFDIETELTVHTLSLNIPAAEIETAYAARPAGSVSKLNTWRDGLRILRAIANLFRDERPLAFFSLLAAMLAAVSIILVVPVVLTFFETGLVPRLPTAVLATSLMLLAFLSLVSGLILDTVSQGRREMKRLHYLQYRPPGQ
ncbi:MAG: glycosyl transferase [Alphaproteobacteria bacterium]|nr:glycosyl transferase [Alphaproteobacteria bacterium]